MAEKVYVLARFKPKEARFALSAEELKSRREKIEKIREEAGGKILARFNTWSSEWRAITVQVFPDMEAYHKYRTAVMSPQGMNSVKYNDVDITLGFEPPA